MRELLDQLLQGRKLLILGFGREGRSTFRYIRQQFPGLHVSVADIDPGLAEDLSADHSFADASLFLGPDYMAALQNHQLIIKSPGVSIPGDEHLRRGTIVTSQTRLMLEAYHRQIIGITGTKGKSTTSSLVHHMLNQAGIKTVLAGNIGLPPFDYIHELSPATIIVYEMSSHQLEDTEKAPHISVLLNLYPEHLDRYNSPEHYYDAKMRIVSGQAKGDVFIYNEDIPEINRRIGLMKASRRFLSFSFSNMVSNGCYFKEGKIFFTNEGKVEMCFEITDGFTLKGRHNLMNAMAAILAAKSTGAGEKAITEGLGSFKGLEHRLEYVGNFRGIEFYNDSIATIPEATLAAIDALPDTDTLILGGFDRMLDYGEMIGFLASSHIRNFIFLGKAGERMLDLFKKTGHRGKHLIGCDSLNDAMEYIVGLTQPGKICLLSPAAASYDSFRNFEERGNVFKKLVRSL